MRVKLGLASEQLGPATSATKNTHALFVEQGTGVGALGSGLAQHVILKFAKFAAPLVVRFIDGVVQFGLLG